MLRRAEVLVDVKLAFKSQQCDSGAALVPRFIELSKPLSKRPEGKYIS